MFNAALLQKHNILSSVSMHAAKKGVRNASSQLLQYAVRGLQQRQNLSDSISKILGSAIQYSREIDSSTEAFMFWSSDVAQAGELALALCSTTVQIQNAAGQFFGEVLKRKENVPKSFSDLIKGKSFRDWNPKIVQVLDEYWLKYGSMARHIRDQEQHFPVELSRCWVNMEAKPTIEIEYPLDKLGTSTPLFESCKSGFWNLILAIDACCQIAAMPAGEFSDPGPAIDMHNPKLPSLGIIQIIEFDPNLRSFLAVVRDGDLLRFASNITNFQLGNQPSDATECE